MEPIIEQQIARKRKLITIHTPPAQQGFLGPGHTARAIIQTDFRQSDPFIMLMDDRLNKQDGEPVGGPHPHAGFETVTLLLEGEIGDSDHQMKAGDFQIMTAGSGIVHSETIDRKTSMHLLQLWLNLPKNDRWATPRVQDLPLAHVPERAEKGVSIRVYSGSFAGVTSPIQNYVPLVVAEMRLQPGSSITQLIPDSLNTFLYVIEGSVTVGEENTTLQQGQVGWLNRLSGNGQSELQLGAGENGGRVVLYAGQPQHEPIVSYGPFIADTQDEIRNLYKEFRQGKMDHVSNLPQRQRLTY